MNCAFQNLSSEKSAGTKSPAPSWMGNNRRKQAATDGGSKMARTSIKPRATTVVPVTTVMPACERDAAAEFSALVLPFSRGELARAANRSKDAARKWKEGQALPNAYTMIMLGRKIPIVRSWMASKLGMADGASIFLSPEVMTSLLAFLYQVSHQDNPDGDAARKLLTRMGRGEI